MSRALGKEKISKSLRDDPMGWLGNSIPSGIGLRKLDAAIIERAWLDVHLLIKNFPELDCPSRTELRSLCRWFKSKNRTWIYSFEAICYRRDLNPEAFRKAVRQVIEQARLGEFPGPWQFF